MAGRNLQSHIACDECRAHKFRCSRERPSCSWCVKHNAHCVYSLKPTRSRLTREYVTSLEERLREYEDAFAKLFPGKDVESLPNLGPLASQSGDEQKSKSTSEKSSEQLSEREAPDSADETFPEEAEGFDWMEYDPGHTPFTDGMAALSLNPRGRGYLGVFSNSSLLRALHSHGWPIEDPEQQQDSTTYEKGQTQNQPTPLLINPSSSRQTNQILIDAYFHFYHTAYPLIHEASFRAQHNELIPRPPGRIWEIILHAVLAKGAWSLRQGDSVLENPFYLEARNLLKEAFIFESGSLPLVQALALLGNLTQKEDKPNTAYNFLGLAVRMAISIGLHKELPDWNISLLKREMRRRVWWMLVIFDSGAAITFGRPITLPATRTTDVKDMLNVHDADLTAATSAIPLDPNEPTLYSVPLANAQFSKLANPIYTQLLAKPACSAERLSEFDQMIEAAMNNLPEYLKEDHISSLSTEWLQFNATRLIWRFRNFRILINRPIVMRWAIRRASRRQSEHGTPEEEGEEDHSSAEQRARLACLENAHSTIISVRDFTLSPQASTLMAIWYAMYFLFQASIIPCIFICAAPESPDMPSWLHDVQIAREVLNAHNHAASNTNTRLRLASKFIAVINRLCATLEGNHDTFPHSAGQTDFLNELSLQFAFGGHHDNLSGDYDLDMREYFDGHSPLTAAGGRPAPAPAPVGSALEEGGVGTSSFNDEFLSVAEDINSLAGWI
ncbi:hypothetical protein L228DRAFT_152596 [Xylona heveae TC161]|uniref:Zn(2)-C6 fungal-type domain-containing protein n=1 Tax=Xylona heveae (strain CBS 132557 / TC161) TaxID=1328760 RepID=A0A165GP38_XYLHT|nr:hypothetical protein L228DRAFT_152596 [Xylona heveae TC161]KZF22424.1 hypothetical protein L228DRAFT_152596 [Xylona heveae TC161]